MRVSAYKGEDEVQQTPGMVRHAGGGANIALQARLSYSLPWAIPIAPPLVFLLLFLVGPSLSLLFTSFYTFVPGWGVVPTLTLDNYAAMAREPLYWGTIVNTFRVGAVVTLVSLALGYPVAYFMGRGQSRWAGLCTALVIAPLFVSVVTRSFGWMVLFAKSGVVNQTLIALGLLREPVQLLYTEFAVMVGMIHILSPFMILPIASVIRGLNPAIHEAALSLGASRTQAFLRITLPLSLPGIIAGCILVYAHAISAFVLPALLGTVRMHLMATMLYQQVMVVANLPFASVLAMTLIVTTFGLFYLVYRLFGVRVW